MEWFNGLPVGYSPVDTAAAAPAPDATVGQRLDCLLASSWRSIAANCASVFAAAALG